MQEFDKDNFYILLGLSLVWFYFIFEPQNIWTNLSVAATAFSLYLFVTKLYEERSGFFSTLFFLSMLGTGISANFSGKGATVGLLLTLLFLSYLWKKYWCMYPLMALGIYYVGIWFAVFVLTVIFLHCIILGRMERFTEMHLIRGLLLVIVALMPFNLQQYQNLSIDLLPQLFDVTKLLPQNNYPIQLNGVGMIFLIICFLLPWLILFAKGIVASISDCRNEEFENHMLLHLWWIIGTICIFYLGKDYYPLIAIIYSPIAILLGWSSQRIEKNFNPMKKIGSTQIWDCLFSFFLLAVIWHYLGTWNAELVFESNLVALLLIIFALIAVFAFCKFQDCSLFILIQIVAGIVQTCFFYIYFYPVLSI